MLTQQDLDQVVAELATKPGHEKVRVLLHRLLVDGLLADSRQIDFERHAPEVRGRIDALLGRTIFELKSDLARERNEAEKGLCRYLSEREQQTGDSYIGIATDGSEFAAYFRRGDSVVNLSSFRTQPSNPRQLLVWLQGTVAIDDGLVPDAETITREFGRESLAARRALEELDEVWQEVGQSTDARLKRELWDRLLSAAYGADVGDDRLFLQHTYLVVVAKSMAWLALIDAPPSHAAELLAGTAFSDLGITGQSEPDFFNWVVGSERGRALVMRVAQQVNRFHWRDITVDLLKALYESLIDPETRRDLGEYYTPDWLASRIVDAVVKDPLEERMLDPACGSGTFLFHAVRAVLAACEASGLPPAQAVRRAAGQVTGIDVHPVAVIIARVTYLLALMPTLRLGHPGEISLPVYLGDALQWNLSQSGQEEAPAELFSAADTLEIFVPAVKVAAPERKVLAGTVLAFPADTAANPGEFNQVVSNMISFGERAATVEEFAAWMERETSASPEDRDVLRRTFDVMRRLQGEGRNHIWGYVARNLARPVWLSREEQKADIVLGNPPWLAYRNMRGYMQTRYKSEAASARVWWTGRGTSGNDLSAYFYMRAALLYLKPTGQMAFVMPFAALSRRAYRPFRSGEVGRSSQVEFYLKFQDVWTFGPEVAPLFPVPSCVLFASVHEAESPAKLPKRVRAFRGLLPHRDVGRSIAEARLTERMAPWPDEAVGEGESPYRQSFRQGALFVPRRLMLVERQSTSGVLPSNPAFPLVKGRTGAQDKKPWKLVEPPRGTIEGDFLRPVLLGECVAPFRVLRSVLAVVPCEDSDYELLDSDGAAGRGYPRLAQWLDQAEEIWNQFGRGKRSLSEQYDYFGQLSAQFPTAAIRVVYTKAGTNLAATVVQDTEAVIDHKLYWAAFERVEEAHYLCAILNSRALRTAVQRYQSQGQWGPRDFDKYVFNLPIHGFEESNPLHQELVETAQAAESTMRGLPMVDGEYFTRTRKRARELLVQEGLANQLDRLTAALFGVG